MCSLNAFSTCIILWYVKSNKCDNCGCVFYHLNFSLSWSRHEMETFSVLLALCAGNSPVTGEFPAQRPVTRSFDVFFDLRLNKQLSKQSWGWWFETPYGPLWRHCNVKQLCVGSGQVCSGDGCHLHISAMMKWLGNTFCILSQPQCVNANVVMQKRQNQYVSNGQCFCANIPYYTYFTAGFTYHLMFKQYEDSVT